MKLQPQITVALPIGATVRYHGSLADEHGYYRVAWTTETGRMHLDQGSGLCEEGQRLSFVGANSVTVVKLHP